MSKKDSSFGFAMGILTGVIGGIVGGILFAPKSGEESRKELKEAIDEIKEIIKTNESLAGLILQFSKKGPAFARAFRGEFLTPEDETLIREIEERNKTFTDTLSESALDVKPNELRRMLIKKLKHSDESGSMSV